MSWWRVILLGSHMRLRWRIVASTRRRRSLLGSISRGSVCLQLWMKNALESHCCDEHVAEVGHKTDKMALIGMMMGAVEIMEHCMKCRHCDKWLRVVQ